MNTATSHRATPGLLLCKQSTQSSKPHTSSMCRRRLLSKPLGHPAALPPTPTSCEALHVN